MNTNENETKVRVLTIKQAAEKVEGLSEYRIRQLCISGELPCIKAGRKYLISEYVKKVINIRTIALKSAIFVFGHTKKHLMTIRTDQAAGQMVYCHLMKREKIIESTVSVMKDF